ncbi:MAG: hypothetical protein AAGE84_14715 [Cyanobacteria bacterium P01_G01_bin.39]
MDYTFPANFVLTEAEASEGMGQRAGGIPLVPSPSRLQVFSFKGKRVWGGVQASSKQELFCLLPPFDSGKYQ